METGDILLACIYSVQGYPKMAQCKKWQVRTTRAQLAQGFVMWNDVDTNVDGADPRDERYNDWVVKTGQKLGLCYRSLEVWDSLAADDWVIFHLGWSRHHFIGVDPWGFHRPNHGVYSWWEYHHEEAKCDCQDYDYVSDSEPEPV